MHGGRRRQIAADHGGPSRVGAFKRGALCCGTHRYLTTPFADLQPEPAEVRPAGLAFITFFDSHRYRPSGMLRQAHRLDEPFGVEDAQLHARVHAAVGRRMIDRPVRHLRLAQQAIELHAGRQREQRDAVLVAQAGEEMQQPKQGGRVVVADLGYAEQVLAQPCTGPFGVGRSTTTKPSSLFLMVQSHTAADRSTSHWPRSAMRCRHSRSSGRSAGS
jgi:hypothetical protein